MRQASDRPGEVVMFEPPVTYSFARGVLHVADRTREIEVSVHPKPVARHRLLGEDWFACEPPLRLVLPPWTGAKPRQLELPFGGEKTGVFAEPSTRPGEALDCLRLGLREEVAQAVQGFHWDQWRCLLWLHHLGDAGMDMMRANPALAYLMARVWGADADLSQPKKRERVLNILRHKQTLILGFLKLPSEKRLVQVLRKWATPSLDPVFPERMRRIAAKPDLLQALAHCPRINLGAYHLAANPTLLAMVKPTFLLETCARPREDAVPMAAHLLQETLGFRRRLRVTTPEPIYGHCDELEAEHRRLSDEIEILDDLLGDQQAAAAGLAKPVRSTKLPDPPIPGTADIRHLASRGDLVREGKEQSNCVATYYKLAKNGGICLYAVDKPERATLMISRGHAGRWRIAEIKIAGNKEVAAKTLLSVTDWLRASGKG